jgi:hypothetical protein
MNHRLFSNVHRAVLFGKFLSTLLVFTLLSGCFKDEPTNTNFEEYFRTSINNYSLYKDYFEIDGLTRTNGWKDGENYLIQGSARLKSKVSYLDMVSEVAILSDAELKKNQLGQLGMGLTSLARGFSGEDEEFQEFWQQQVRANTVPASLLAQQSSMDSKRFLMLLNYSDHALLQEYGNIIGRNLKKGDELTRTYTLTFKNTEKGWMGFGAQ